MTAKAGKHRTVRLPEALVLEIDKVRHTVPRERWIRDALRGIVERELHEPLGMRATAPLTERAMGEAKAAIEAVSGSLEAEFAEAVRHDRNEARLRAATPPAKRLRLKRPEPKP